MSGCDAIMPTDRHQVRSFNTGSPLKTSRARAQLPLSSALDYVCNVALSIDTHPEEVSHEPHSQLAGLPRKIKTTSNVNSFDLTVSVILLLFYRFYFR